MAKKGRQNYYETLIKPNLDNIKHWIYEGYSHDQIMNMLGIKSTTWYKYAALESDFKEVLRIGKMKLGIKLERALYKEAEGFTYKEEHIEVEQSHLGEKKKKRIVTKYARANAALLVFSLCNKFPRKWKRVDKEIIDAIEEGKVRLDVTDKHIKDAFKALYPAMEKNSVDKIKNTKNFEDSKNGKE